MIEKFTKDLTTNIIQIIVVVLLLPMVFFILALINGTQEGLMFLLDVIGEIKIFDVLMDFVSTCLKAHDPSLIGNPDIYMVHVTELFETLDTSMFQLLSITLCVRICNILCDIVKWPGIRILSSVLGVIFGYAVAILYDIPILALLFLLLLLIVLDMIFLFGRHSYTSDLILKYVLVTLKISLEMLAVIFMTGFIAILLVIWQGNVASFGMTVFMIAIFFIPWISLLAVNRYLLPSAD